MKLLAKMFSVLSILGMSGIVLMAGCQSHKINVVNHGAEMIWVEGETSGINLGY